MDVGTARMLKTLINHLILDCAISVMFQTIASNFTKPTNIKSINLDNFRLGDIFKSISIITEFDYDETDGDPIVASHEVIYSATIEEINPRDIYVTYMYCESYDIYHSGETSGLKINRSDGCYVWLSDVIGIVK